MILFLTAPQPNSKPNPSPLVSPSLQGELYPTPSIPVSTRQRDSPPLCGNLLQHPQVPSAFAPRHPARLAQLRMHLPSLKAGTRCHQDDVGVPMRLGADSIDRQAQIFLEARATHLRVPVVSAEPYSDQIRRRRFFAPRGIRIMFWLRVVPPMEGFTSVTSLPYRLLRSPASNSCQSTSWLDQ